MLSEPRYLKVVHKKYWSKPDRFDTYTLVGWDPINDKLVNETIDIIGYKKWWKRLWIWLS